MAEKAQWENKVLKSWGEYRNNDKQLKSRWELVQSSEVGGKGKTRPSIQKTSFYEKDGKLTRGFPQSLNIFDLNYLVENAERLRKLIKSVPGGGSVANKGVPTSVSGAPDADETYNEEPPF